MARLFLLFPASLWVSNLLCVCVKEEGEFFQARCAVGSIPEALGMMAFSLVPVV